MVVFLNNKEYLLGGGIDLSSFLTCIKVEVSRGIAIAVNDLIIPRSAWNAQILKENDKITIITAAAGG